MVTKLINPFRNKPTQYFINLGLFGLILFAFALLGFGLKLSHVSAMSLVHPIKSSYTKTPDEYGIANWRNVDFMTPDGLLLSGWYIPPSKKADGATIIFTHGFKGNREDYLSLASRLHQDGFGALLFDMRNHGESEGNITTLGGKEPLDVRGAIDFLMRQPEINPSRIGLAGASLGAGVAIIAAAQYEEINALLVESPFASLEDTVGSGISSLFGLPPFPFAPAIIWFAEQETDMKLEDVRPIDHIQLISPRPILLIHGEFDTMFKVENSILLFEKSFEPKSLYIVPGAGHGNLSQLDPIKYNRVILDFFLDNLINN